MSRAKPPNLDFDLEGLSIAELERDIRELEAYLQPYLDRRSALKIRRRALIAGSASVKARAAEVEPAAVLAAFDALPGGRGHIPELMKQFNRSESTIHRKLKQGRSEAGRRHPRDRDA